MSALTRLFLRTMARTGGLAGAWALLLLTAGALAQVLTVIQVPSLHCAALLVAGALGHAATLAAEVALVAGPTAALAELRADGSWLGLRSVGTRGRDLLLPVGAWAAALGLVALVGGHVLDPAARRALRDARVEATVAVRLVPGETTSLGPWAVSGEGARTWFATDAGGDEVTGYASDLRLQAAQGAAVVTLGPGEAHAANGEWSLRFGSLEAAIPVSGGARIEAGERPTATLLASKLDPYERWILWKRSLIPLALAPVAALGLPLGARLRPGLGVGALGLLCWTALRLSDTAAHTATALGALLLLGPAIGALALGWATWRDR